MPLSEKASLDETSFFATSGDTVHITASRLSSDRMKATSFSAVTVGPQARKSP